MKQPNFFIVGAAKAGTTSLHHFLDEHPDIHLLDIKEPNYFSHKEIQAQNLYFDSKHISDFCEYEKLFKGLLTRRIGESSASYLFYPGVAERIHEYNPKAKIIILLRNPIDRAFSHYQMDRRQRLVKSAFDDIIQQRKNDRLSQLHYQQYVELGFYAKQVARYLEVFPRDQICIALTEAMIKDSSTFMERMYNFLKVDSSFQVNGFDNLNESLNGSSSLIRNRYGKKSLRKGIKSLTSRGLRGTFFSIGRSGSKSKQIDDESKDVLKNLYLEDIKKLEKLIQRNLNHWYE